MLNRNTKVSLSPLSAKDSNGKPAREEPLKNKPKTATSGSSFWVYVFLGDDCGLAVNSLFWQPNFNRNYLITFF
jgi:hypothetical protein